MKNHNACLLLFVKYPEKGQVKLRLSADLNVDIVQELYRRFVYDTLATVKKIDAEIFVCFFPPDAQKKFQEWLGSDLVFLPQQGTDLGERMKNSFSSAFLQGFRRVILMGSDSPDLPASFLQNSLAELQTHDVVLGPSSDGGYYLIGFRDTSFDPLVFDDIHWSSPRVLKETMEKIQCKKNRLSLLPVWSDVDTIIDLKNLIQRNRNTSFKSSQTITFVQQNKILLEDDDVTKPKK
ncbi:MAG TPA: glycosyltransferase [Thermoplasmata archaeon]|nr:MAG TPA: glycosyltransferase [Thermoplasmata archaeon]